MKTVCTNKDYIKFITYCREYIHKLRLDNWDVDYRFKKECCDKLSTTLMTPVSFTATILLYSDWGSEVKDSTLREVAYHEVIHILMAEYFEDAMDKQPEVILRKTEHEIIQRLCLAAFMKRKK